MQTINGMQVQLWKLLLKGPEIIQSCGLNGIQLQYADPGIMDLLLESYYPDNNRYPMKY